MSPTSFLKYVWQPLLKAAGLPYRKPHGLRHTDASPMIQHGVNLAYVKEQLGHASIKMTVGTYGHLIPGANKNAVDQLDDRARHLDANRHRGFMTQEDAYDRAKH